MSKTEQEWLEETIALYDVEASTYAENVQDSTPFIAMYETFLALIPPGGTIVDVGCGSGRDMLYFLEAGYDVQGIDLSSGLLEQAILRGVPRERLFQTNMMDIETLFAPKSRDGIWMFAVLVHMSKDLARRAIQKSIACLKPGGVLHLGVKFWKEGTTEQAYKASISLPGVEKRYIYRKQDELVDLLTVCGCNIERISYDIYDEKDSRLHILATTQ